MSDANPLLIAGYETITLYINGEFISTKAHQKENIINPATLEIVGQFPHATQADLDLALSSAKSAFESWRHSSPLQRSEILRKVAQSSREQAESIGRNIS